jgi:hemoglobin
MSEPTLPQSAASHPFNAANTPYAAMGGEAAVRSLVEAFYDRMDADAAFARIRALHKASLNEARDKLYEFLCGWLGGPQLYMQKYGHPRLRARHAPFAIGEPERDLWLQCMQLTLDARGVTGDLRAFLDQRFAHVADFMRNIG